MIPGVEVAPHYYWTGSLLSGDLTMHNSQRNLLVFGLPKGDDYTGLPASGNPQSFQGGWSLLFSMSPLLLLVPAGWFWQRRVEKSKETAEVQDSWRSVGHRDAAAVAESLAFWGTSLQHLR